MAGREAPTKELKAEREAVLAEIQDRSSPVAALLPPASQALSPGQGRDQALQGGARIQQGSKHAHRVQRYEALSLSSQGQSADAFTDEVGFAKES